MSGCRVPTRFFQILFVATSIWLSFLCPRATAADAPAADAPAAEQRRIKVGVILSHYSATGPGWFNKPIGFGYTNKAFREGILDSSFDLFPVIEPGTAQSGELPAMCTKYFPNVKPIECTDTAAMSTLDVIVAPFVTNATPEMLNAVEHAVRDDGKGLVIRAWFGALTPKFTPQVQAVNGLIEGHHAWSPNDAACDIVASHPILGELSGQQNATIKMEPNGAMGVLNGHALIRVPQNSSVTPISTQPTTERADFVIAPLFIAKLGKGRIVNCAWLGHANDTATTRILKEISIRSIQWAAGRLPERPGDVGAEEGL